MQARGGVFIVIEGIDGAGKTLHSRNLCFQLHKMRYEVRYTAEPSNSFVGRLIREEFLHRRKIPPEMETLLFAADRFQHIQNQISPILQQNGIVVSDRYYYASIAYQGAQGVDIEWIRFINNFAFKPDLAIYMDVPPDVALSRIRRSKSVMEQLDLQKKVREIYLELVRKKELTYIDGNQSIEAVDRETLDLALEVISKKENLAQNKPVSNSEH